MASVFIHGTTGLQPSHFVAPDFQLSPETIDVWILTLTNDVSYFNQFLTTTELERALRYRNPRVHDQFVMGRAVLRLLSAKYIGQPSDVLVYEETPESKPYWKTPAQQLQFNLTHSGDRIAICFGNKEIGIDMEQSNERFAYEDVLDRCFSEEEKKSIRSAREPRSMFYQCWTRKEALVKAVGSGLQDDIVSVPCMDGEQASRFSKDWELRSFGLEQSVWLTLAYQPPVTKIRFMNFINPSG